MKKLFLISLFVCVGILQSLAFDYTDERGVTWSCSETGWNEDTQSYTSACINSATGYGDEVVIPEKVYDGTKEYTVTSIGFKFQDNKTLEKVTWPSTVTEISYGMFRVCSNLKVVENIRKVTYIDNNAFEDCNNLIELDLGSCTIESQAFYNCSNLQSIGELAKCTSVGCQAFYRCSSLENIDLSMCTSVGLNAFGDCSSLLSIGNPRFTSIPDNAFSGCSSLENIDLSLCTSVGSGAFAGCSKLQNVNTSNCTYIGGSAFYGCSSITEVDLSACKSLGDNAFNECTKLENVIGLENFKSIPNGAFRATALKSVNLSVCTTIGSSAFDGCSSITEVDLSACKEIGFNAFSRCTKLENVIGLENLKSIPNGAFYETALKSVNLLVCTTIGREAFYGCSGLQSVELPVCVSIDDRDTYDNGGAFEYCTSLTNLKLPQCTTVGSSAFYGCCSLQSVDLPKVESIKSKAFWGSGITKVSLPETLKSMGYNCFDKVKEYTFYGTQPAVFYKDSGSAFSCASYIIRVPESAIDAYKAADVWKNYKDKIFSISDQLYYDVTTTAMDSQSGLEQAIGATNMKKVISLKATGTINGYDIFMIRTKMTNLQNLDLTDADIVANGFAYYESYGTEDNVVGRYSFYNLYNLVTLKLPKNAIIIDSYAVANCSSLESVDFPKNLKYVNDNSFYGCCELDNVILPDGLEYIGFDDYSCCI